MTTIGHTLGADIPVAVDLHALRGTHLGVIANSGAGKSGLVRKILEVTHGEIQQIILDPDDEYYTLREGGDYIIAGGEDGDCPATPENAAQLVHLLLTTSISAVIQLNHLKGGDPQAFVSAFITALMEAPRDQWRPILLVIDEAHRFCLDAETELLTDKGWRNWDQIKVGDRAACFDLAGETYSFGAISDVLVREHRGDMISLNSDGIDCLATPDHRVVHRVEQRASGRRKLYPWTFRPAGDLPNHIMIPKGGAPVGAGIDGLSPETCRVLGWIITDGNIHDRKARRPALIITQSPATTKRGMGMADVMGAVLETLPGVKRAERVRLRQIMSQPKIANRTEHRWYVGPDAAAEFMGWLGTDIHRIPRRILQEGSVEQLNALFQGLMEGDGTAVKHEWYRFYPGKNEGLADDFQELALRLGYSATKRFVPQNGQWRIDLSARRHHYIRKPGKQHYQGVVWDITVPTGAFVARRNGRVFVTGNCPQDGATAATEAVRDLFARGRKRGFTGVLATQRMASIEKMVTANINNWALGRVGQATDRKVVLDALGFSASSADGKTLMAMEDRVFWVFGRGLGARAPLQMRVADVATTMVESGEAKIATAPAPEKLKKLLQELNKPAPAPKVAAEASERPAGPTEAEIEAIKSAAFKRGLDKGYDEGYRRGIEKVCSLATDHLAGVLGEQVGVAAEDIDEGDVITMTLGGGPDQLIGRVEGSPRSAPVDGVALTQPQYRILDALAWFESAGIKAPHRFVLAFMAGQSATSSGYANNLGAMRTARVIDYPGSGLVTLSSLGRAAATPPKGKLSNDQVQRAILDKLSAPQRRIMEVLLAGYPDGISRNRLAELSEQSPTSSGFANNLGSLRSLGVLDYPDKGFVVATSLMFPFGR